MASLRTSSSSAARLLRTATQPRRAFLPTTTRRFESTSSSPSSSVPAKQDEASSSSSAPTTTAPATPSHAPDWSAHIDRATSTFTPVPHRLQDGSEPGEVLPAAVLSGAPMELQARTVRIYQPSKPATQSGTWGASKWRMDWDVLPRGHRWENPLMGWQSSGDYMQGTHLNFKSREDAVAFAEKQGYEYFVQEPNARHFAPKAYANNFLYSPKKLKHIRTK